MITEHDVHAPAWRLLETGHADGATNMAIDEAILLACSQGQVPPTLRFYGWSPPCLSLGYFQSSARQVNLEECARQGIDCVRRLTGGRAVLHDRELTYSIVLPASHPLAAGGIASSYRRLSRGIFAGLINLGVPIQSLWSESQGSGDEPQYGLVECNRASPSQQGASPCTTGGAGNEGCPGEHVARQNLRGRGATAACFDATADFELAVDGRKLVGSAQTRKRGAVLQHGTILIDFDASRLVALLVADTTPPDLFTEVLRGGVVSLREVLGREVACEEVAQAVAGGFERALGITLVPSGLTPLEARTSADLAETKYGNREWTLRR